MLRPYPLPRSTGRTGHRAVLALVAALVAAGLAVVAVATPAAADVTSNSKDLLRSGWYPDQPGLSPGLVGGGTFGQQFSAAVDGQVYAQPLVSNNTLLVATENNNAYGLDPGNGAQRWTRNFGTPWNPADVSCADLAPNVGITGTPVVDPTTNTMYMLNKTYASGTSGPAAWWAQAVDVTTGAERPGFPVQISGTASNFPGQVFNPTTQLQRPGLLLLDGVVYAAFGGHCDYFPYDGWIAGISTAGKLTTLWVDESTKGGGAGIWQSGGGLVSDGPGQILLTTGNGNLPATGSAGHTPPTDLGQAVVRLGVQPDGSLKATDYFIPYDALGLNDWDADLGSGSPMALPAEFGTTAHPHLMIQTGKQGYVYLLDRDNLGGMGQGASGGDAVLGRYGPDGGVWGKPAAWPGDGGYIYVTTASAGSTSGGTSGQLNAYKYGVDGSGTPTLSLVGRSSDAFGLSSSPPVVTSDGTTSGSALVWVIYAPGGSGTGAQLRAYQPVPVNGKMVQVGSWPIGISSKFNQPAVDGNKVFVGTRDGHVLKFGSPVTVPMSAPAATFPTTTVRSSSAQTVTLTANAPLTVTSVVAGGDFSAGTPSPTLPATMTTGQTMTVPVTFTPTVVGQDSGALTVTTSIGTVRISLNGTGQSASAQITASPPAVSFGGVPVSQSATGTATFSNTGAQPLTIQAWSQPAAPFTVTGLPAVGTVINSGQSFTVTATFSPTTVGTFTDELDLTTSAGEAEVPMSGSSAQSASLVITPLSTDLGRVPVGAVVTTSFTVANTGGSPATITKSKPPVAGTGFTATSALAEGTSIAAGQTVTETVQFAPTAVGSANDAWVITGTDGTGLQTVSFTGTGVPAGAVPAPTDASWTKNGTATLVGSVLQLTDATTAGSAGSAFYSNPVDSSYLDISFDASIDGGGGADGLTLALADPTAGATATSVGVAGGGLGWAKIPGIAVALDTFATPANPSNNFVGVATGFSQAANDQLIWATTNSAVPALRGAAHHVRVLVFQSVLTMYLDGSVVLTTPVKLAATTLIGFTGGDGAITDRHAISNVVITSIGTQKTTVPAAPTAISTVPADGAATVSWQAPTDNGGAPLTGYVVTVSPGGRQIPVSGTPLPTTTTVTGLTNGTAYTFTVAAMNSVGTGAASAASRAVTPTAATGTVVLSGATLDLGTVPLSGSSTASFTVKNPGANPVTVTGSTPPTGQGFTATTTLAAGTVLAAGSTTTETVTFTPTTVGAAAASWTFAGSDGSTATIALRGTGARAKVLPDPSAGGWTVNGTAAISGSALQLTASDATFAAGSAFFPTAVPSGYLDVSFDAAIGGGGGADGLTLALADPAGTTPTSVGLSGSGLGWSGINGVAVALDTFANGTDPSNNFVGVATGVDPANPANLTWKATATGVPDLRAATRHIQVHVALGQLTVSVDGVPVITTAVTLSPTTLIGFTGGSGLITDRHAVSNVVVTSAAAAAVSSAPTAVTAIAHDGSAAVSWTAPTDNGGSAITGYRVVGTPAGSATVVGTATSATVTGLTNGTAYRFTVVATNGIGDSAASAASTAVTPLAAQAVPVSVSVADATLVQPATTAGTLNFVLSLSAASTSAVTVAYRTVDGTALAGTDYQAVTGGSVTFAAGQTSKTVPVTVTARPWHGTGSHTMTLQLGAVSGAVVVDGSGTGRLLASQGPISVTARDVVVQQGAAAGSAVFTLSLSAAPAAGETVSVVVATANGTAKAGTDYTALTARTVTFASGVRSATVSVPVAAGTALVANRAFTLQLSAPSATAVLARTFATATLRRSRSAAVGPGVYVADGLLARPASGSAVMNFTVSLSAAATVPVTVTYQTADGSGRAGSEYTAVPATSVTFAAGVTSKTVAVMVLGSGVHSGALLDFHLKVTKVTGGPSIIDGDGVGRLVNVQGPLLLSAADVTVTQGATASSAVFTLSLSAAPVAGDTASLTVATVAGTASSPADFTLLTARTVTFAAGVRTVTVTVPVAASVGARANRSFTLALSGPSSVVALTRGTVTATLLSR